MVDLANFIDEDPELCLENTLFTCLRRDRQAFVPSVTVGGRILAFRVSVWYNYGTRFTSEQTIAPPQVSQSAKHGKHTLNSPGGAHVKDGTLAVRPAPLCFRSSLDSTASTEIATESIVPIIRFVFFLPHALVPIVYMFWHVMFHVLNVRTVL